MPNDLPTSVTGELPDGLLDAFWNYERALESNDLDALDALFAPGPSTLRGDAAGLLVGHDQISGFRGRRGGTRARTIRSMHVRVITPDTALIVSSNSPTTGGFGLITQLWARLDGGWQIEAAHVSAPPSGLDPSVWRVAGSPLVAPRGSGPLDGETVAVKDLFDVTGFAVGAGNPEFLASSAAAERTAPALRALLDAGASVRGIAQTDEFAYSIAGNNVHYGTPPNPAAPDRISGGSSSGPAAAVALGQASIGLATDTAGSIRVPASYQGLWGLRTTHGLVDRDGLLALAPSFDAIGWLARTAAVLRAAAAATIGTGGQVTASDRFVISPSLLGLCDRPVAAAFNLAVDRLVADGRMTAPALIELDDLAGMFQAFRTVQAAEAWRANGAWITAHPGALAPDVAARFDFASQVTHELELSARDRLAEARVELEGILDGRTLLLPSASSVAPSRSADAASIDATRTATLSMTCVAGIGGYPAISAPLLEVDGKPVGVCLVGARGSDLSLVDLAATLA
jgi:amidase